MTIDPAAPGLIVRDARPADRPVIVEFNRRLALETEHKRLDAEVLDRGVARALAEPDRLRYWVAEAAMPEGPRIVGQTAITREWSDWRDGWIWWLQSVYVDADHRGRGVFKALFRHLRAEALAAPDVIGVRLYVENGNAQAQRTYEALGMRPGGYSVLEELWIHGARPSR
ncbi:putative acetyltransferase [Aquisphaera giovannonii]|uniref:Putative acetyltransferase n=1 Tax=Aquisphaera giovannonii TaxID=406548 RepID=A0A5B9W1C4_9BACT|nr:GNAT family N-acetyltransferase [Aquisphaera giovannonii]QEH34328.1 putative acetyltransferase [Aquisphaera giovannonii]